MNLDFDHTMRLGEVADEIDNLIHALMLPMPDGLHLEALRASLPQQRDALREIFVAATGENPWD